MSSTIAVTEQAITINGLNRSLEDVIHAEATVIESYARAAVILLVALVGPIAAMVIATQLNGSPTLGLAFGPVLLVISVALGLAGCLIGVLWKKPYGVIVERQEFGHACILRCENSEQAESIATQIREVISQRQA